MENSKCSPDDAEIYAKLNAEFYANFGAGFYAEWVLCTQVALF